MTADPDRFFPRHELSIGQCPAYREEERQLNGTPLPAFEPYDDPYARSHQLVEKLRNEVDTFDEIAGYEPQLWETSISNLFILADLATAVATHMRQRLDAMAAEEAEWEARWQDRQEGEWQIAA